MECNSSEHVPKLIYDFDLGKWIFDFTKDANVNKSLDLHGSGTGGSKTTLGDKSPVL
jgi:hypothetical protein